MSMDHILNELEGSDVTVFDVLLYNQWKHKNASKTDSLYIIYKDKDGNKKVKEIKNPEMEIFFVDPKYRGEFNTPREYLEIEKCYSKKVNARKVVSTVYEELQNQTDRISLLYNDIYKRSVQTGNFSARKEILKWPYTLFSDLTVEEYYRIMLGYHYNTGDHPHIINKAFLDIESDIFGLSSTEQNLNLDPTNACTVIFNFDENGKVKHRPLAFTFLLRDYKRYPQQRYFEEHLNDFIKQCHKEYDHQTVIKDGKEKIIDVTADYCIKLYDTEAELLTSIFELVNTLKPDTCEIWNIAYDIPKLAARMEYNNLNPIDVMSDPVFPKKTRFLELNIDKRPGIDIADRKTYIRMTSTTKYVDQMQAYANIRKGRKAFGSNKLDNIAKIELGMGKREFGKGIDVTNAAIKDYWNFVLYNIRDVWAQVLVDMVTNDCMTMVYDSNSSNTAIENLSKQTKYQKQIYYTNYLRKGFIPGNNPNVNYIRGESEDSLEVIGELRESRKRRNEIDGESESYDEEDSDEYDEEDQEIAEELTKDIVNIFKDTINRRLYLPGGLVGNPDYNSANGTELIQGVFSKHVYDDVMDMDYASEYPWAKFTRSMSKSTQIGRLIIGEKISDLQNKLPMGQEKRATDIKYYLPGAEFISNYISHDMLSLGHMWFNMPTIEEMNEKLNGKDHNK